MVRVTNAVPRLKKRKKLLDAAKGYWGDRKNHASIARDAVLKAMRNSYIHRKIKKRDFRSLWISRLRVAALANGLPYHGLIHGLSLAKVELNRKSLSEVAIHYPEAFAQVAQVAKTARDAHMNALPVAPKVAKKVRA